MDNSELPTITSTQPNEEQSVNPQPQSNDANKPRQNYSKQQRKQHQQAIKQKANNANNKQNSNQNNKEEVVAVTREVKYIDTHTHVDYTLQKLNLPLSFSNLKDEHFKVISFDEINKVQEGGKERVNCIFDKCITVCCDLESFEPTDLLVKENDDIFAAYGLHPHNAKHYSDEVHQNIADRMNHPKTIAWGEIGLDYHYNMSPQDTQLVVFERQLRAAVEYNKPIVIHTREAEEDTIRLMKEIIPSHWKIHLHCFTSSEEMAKILLEHFSNLYIGLTGVVTFKNSHDVQNVARLVPINRLLLETDAPFMAPMPFRGKTCHSGYIPYTAKKIAELKNLSIQEVLQQTSQNASELYGFPL